MGGADGADVTNAGGVGMGVGAMVGECVGAAVGTPTSPSAQLTVIRTVANAADASRNELRAAFRPWFTRWLSLCPPAPCRNYGSARATLRRRPGHRSIEGYWEAVASASALISATMACLVSSAEPHMPPVSERTSPLPSAS